MASLCGVNRGHCHCSVLPDKGPSLGEACEPNPTLEVPLTLLYSSRPLASTLRPSSQHLGIVRRSLALPISCNWPSLTLCTESFLAISVRAWPTENSMHRALPWHVDFYTEGWRKAIGWRYRWEIALNMLLYGVRTIGLKRLANGERGNICAVQKRRRTCEWTPLRCSFPRPDFLSWFFFL